MGHGRRFAECAVPFEIENPHFWQPQTEVGHPSTFVESHLELVAEGELHYARVACVLEFSERAGSLQA